MVLTARVRPGQGLGAPRMADPEVALLERTMAGRARHAERGARPPFARDSDAVFVPASLLSPDWEAATGQAGYWLMPVLVAGTYDAVAFQPMSLTTPRTSWSPVRCPPATRWAWGMGCD